MCTPESNSIQKKGAVIVQSKGSQCGHSKSQFAIADLVDQDPSEKKVQSSSDLRVGSTLEAPEANLLSHSEANAACIAAPVFSAACLTRQNKVSPLELYAEATASARTHGESVSHAPCASQFDSTVAAI